MIPYREWYMPFQSQVSLTVDTQRAERQRIAEGLRRQDSDLLDELIDRYQHRLLRYLTHLTGRREQAEDIFQETWIRVLERGHQYNDSGDFDSWLFTIARNLSLDAFRRRSMQSLDDVVRHVDDGTPAFDPESSGPSPLDQVSYAERTDAVAAVLNRLQPIHREVLCLHFFEDLSMREISERTGIHMPTVKSRLYRAIRFFGDLVKESSPLMALQKAG